MKWKDKFLVLILFAVLIVLLVPTLTAAEMLFYVEGEELTWILEGLPDSTRKADFRSIQVVRGSDDRVPLVFQLSDIEDDYGNKFPRELIVLKTHYDSAEQSWDRASSARRMLAAKDEYADLEIGVYYHTPVPAGVYRGELYIKGGESIPLEIAVGRYTDIRIDPGEIKMEISGGPGVYKVENPVTVNISANHQHWVLTLGSAGLFYLDDEESSRRSILNRPRESMVEPLELFIVHEENAISATELPQIVGTNHGWRGTSIDFFIQTTVGWEHKAGNYAGVIQVDVELQE